MFGDLRNAATGRVFATSQWVPTALDETFAFFGDARKLERITPPFLHFRIITPPPIPMRVETLIDYLLWLRGDSGPVAHGDHRLGSSPRLHGRAVAQTIPTVGPPP